MLRAPARPDVAAANASSCWRVCGSRRSSADARCVTSVGSACTCTLRRRSLVRCAEVVEAETQSIHAGIDLDPGRHLRVARQCLEQLELFEAVHHQLEPRLRGSRELVGAEHAFEQQDAIGEPGGAQCEPFAKTRDGETVGFRECRCGRHESVAVRVGLDDRHHAAVGCGTPDLAEVVAQCGSIDHRADQALALHGSPRLSRRSRRNRRAQGSRSACTCRGKSGALRPSGRCAAW